MAQEVAVSVLDLPFRFLRKNKIPVQPLLEGLEEPPEYFSNSRNRIDWGTFAEILRRFGTVLGGLDSLPKIGHSFVGGPVWIPLKLIMGTFTKPRTLYHWIEARGSKLLFSNIASTLQDNADGIQIKLVLAPGFTPSEEFFLINRGVLEAVPCLVGYPPATIEMRRMASTTIYDILLPPQRGFFESLRSFFRKFRLNRAVAAAELEKSLQALEQEHRDLQAANRIVERQAKQLQAVEELGRSLLREVEPARIAEAIRMLLHDRVGFASVAYYSASTDSDRLRRVVSTFTEPVDGEISERMLWGLKDKRIARWPSIRFDLLRTVEGQLMGLLLCLPRENGATDLDLYEALLPYLAIAAKHSLAYRDIQELNRGLERRVEERTAELTSAKTALQDTVQRLETAMGARDKLFANLNHEFRTPITLMLLPLERLIDLPELSPYRPRLQAMEVNARKLLRLVDGILELAASQEGRLRLKLERVDVATIARQSLQAYAPAAQELKLELTLEAPEPAVVFGSSEGIGRILDNLLSNALKYTRAGGQIRVRIQNLGDSVQISVHDTGIGIAAADRARIFERFERAGDPVAPGATSTGIGLALVKDLCNWHGGAIAVDSELGKGSTFDVTLPCLPTDDVRAREDRRKSTPSESPAFKSDRLLELGPYSSGLGLTHGSADPAQVSAPAGAPTLLVVEDHPDLRSHLTELLGPTFHVLTAENGIQALEVLAKNPVDLVLSDLVMPGMDGLELCKRVKALPALDMVPFVLLTALHDRTTLIRGLDLGADDFLVKPFNEGELLARVRGQLRIRELAKKLAESNRLAVTGTLLSGMAHELRNPVNVLVNGIAPLRESIVELAPKDPGILALLDALDDAGRRVHELTNELLAFRRNAAETGERVGVPELIGQSLALLKPKLNGVKVETDIAFSGEVCGSAHSLSQVVVNLVENAIHAVNGAGHVGIQAHEVPEGVAVDVWDDGPGVSLENRGRLFEPFFSTKKAGEGTGLGLAISRQIAERHGGQLALQPSDRGARFRLTLPRADP